MPFWLSISTGTAPGALAAAGGCTIDWIGAVLGAVLGAAVGAVEGGGDFADLLTGVSSSSWT